MYGDFQCPYCAAAQSILRRVRERLDGRLRFAFRHMPLHELHPDAQLAAEAAEAAAAQDAFWPMHDHLYAARGRLRLRGPRRATPPRSGSTASACAGELHGRRARRARRPRRGAAREGRRHPGHARVLRQRRAARGRVRRRLARRGAPGPRRGRVTARAALPAHARRARAFEYPVVDAAKRSAVISGVASAVAVCAIFLATDALQTESDREPPRSTPAAPAAPSVRDVYKRARLGVVIVDHRPPGVPPRSGPPTRSDRVATGSGFVVDDAGHVVTNQHVVAGRGTTTVQIAADEDPVAATIVRRDASTDLAVVRVAPADAKRMTSLALGDSDAVRVGDAAIAIGSPLGLQRTLTVGVVSAIGRTITAPDGAKIKDAVQTDAPINPGSSGGPLLDARGRVIGVISQGRASGIGFAVPVDTVKRLVAGLRTRDRTAG